MSVVGDLEAVDAAVAWVAVALSPVAAAAMVLSWVSQHRLAATGPFTGPGDLPPGSGPDPGEDLSSASRSADTRRAGTRSTDRR